MIIVKDPSVIEYVLRAEGKYPLRDVINKRLGWLYQNRIDLLPNHGIE